MEKRDVPSPRFEAPAVLVGIVVGVVAFAGLATLFAALVLMFELPSWLRVGLGIALVPVAAFLMWIVGASLRSSRKPGTSGQSRGGKE